MTIALLYRLTAPSGKQYIGVTTQTVAERVQEHYHLDTVIGKAVRKHGAKMEIETLVVGPTDYIFALEIAAIKAFNTMGPNGYNCHEGGRGGPPTKEACRKISESMKGRSLSDEHRQNLSEAHKGNSHSVETRQKMVAAQRARRATESLVTRQAMAQKMKQIWEEQKA